MSEKAGISPYEGLEPRAFWRSGLVDAGTYPPPDLYRPKFAIPRQMPIMTAGSCFAQHVGKALRGAGFNVLDAEPAPASVPDALAQSYGYRLYSARYGNIYTMRQLKQLLQECTGAFTPVDAVWEKDGRYFDALRPGTEPNGYETIQHLQDARAAHLRAVREVIGEARLMVFTMGLTEAWEHAESGTIYPTAPGTIAGQMSDAYRFRNFRHGEVRADFDEVRAHLQAINPEIRFLLTVSPVPLTATASGQHVLSATTYSKAVLRAVAGELVADFPDVDYFPSFEIVTSHTAPQPMFEANERSVRPEAVANVMATFLRAVDPDALPLTRNPDSVAKMRADRRARRARRASSATPPAEPVATLIENDEDEVVCEESLLAAFEK